MIDISAIISISLLFVMDQGNPGLDQQLISPVHAFPRARTTGHQQDQHEETPAAEPASGVGTQAASPTPRGARRDIFGSPPVRRPAQGTAARNRQTAAAKRRQNLLFGSGAKPRGSGGGAGGSGAHAPSNKKPRYAIKDSSAGHAVVPDAGISASFRMFTGKPGAVAKPATVAADGTAGTETAEEIVESSSGDDSPAVGDRQRGPEAFQAARAHLPDHPQVRPYGVWCASSDLVSLQVLWTNVQSWKGTLGSVLLFTDLYQ